MYADYVRRRPTYCTVVNGERQVQYKKVSSPRFGPGTLVWGIQYSTYAA